MIRNVIASLALRAFVILLPAFACAAHAHDIPIDVRVQAFVKPEGRVLRLIMRVPLEAMREVDVPRRGPGYLDLARADPALRQAANLWLANNIELFEGDERLPQPQLVAARVSLPSDRSFESYDAALAHFTDPLLPNEMDLYWNQQLLDVVFEAPIRSERSDFSINPRLDRLGQRVAIALRFLPPGGAERAYELQGDPGLVRLDPRWHQAALRFVESGVRHILEGADHLLFILCLVIPFRRLRPLLVIVTAFTVAHSITLISAAFGLAPSALWFPPLIETLIAVSILYMAIENVVGANLRRRWLVAFGFGLVHGFGFAFALREQLQFAGSHLVTALLAFNVGVEIGQVLVLLALVPLLDFILRRPGVERVGIILFSAFVAHTAWHWMLERIDTLRKFPSSAPDAAFFASVVRVLLGLLIAAGLIWLARRALLHLRQQRRRM